LLKPTKQIPRKVLPPTISSPGASKRPMNGVERIVQTIEAILQKVKPTQFSESGWLRLNLTIKQYVNKLIKESVKVARDQRSDSVSADYVTRASDVLSWGRVLKKKQRVVGIVGNILLGIGVKYLLDMISAYQYPTPAKVIASVVLIGIGSVGVWVQLRD
jgi:hypothetical protein